MKTLTKILGCLVVTLGTTFSMTASAQSINELISSGKFRIGVNSAAPPFSIVDTSGNVVGYDVDTGTALAEHLGVDPEFTAYATAARIPALESGRVDMVVGTLTPTPARARVVMFTMPYVTFGTGIVAEGDSAIASFADLFGKTVGVARGTPQETKLVASAPEDAKILRFDDDSIALQALAAGQVDAVAVPDTIYIEFKKKRPDTSLEIKFSIARQFMSIAVRKDSYELRQWLNTVLAFMKVNGQLDAISEKWTGKPFPKDAPVF